MSFFKSMDISASALTANRFRMDTIAQNIANASTTRTTEGEGPDAVPYRRRVTVMQERKDAPFSRYYGDALSYGERRSTRGLSFNEGDGVRVAAVYEDPSEFKLDYNPNHPDADEEGYVRLPNVETAREMIDMMDATRSYEANVTVLNSIKAMGTRALEIGRS